LAPSIFDGVEKLDLKLESHRVAMEILVIEKVPKKLAPN
jgi:hypothetical protein